MDLESVKEESIKQPLRVMAIPSTQTSCTEKRWRCTKQNDMHSPQHPKCPAEPEERCILCFRDLKSDRTAFHSIATTSKGIFAMTIAEICVAIIHQHESIPVRSREGNTSFLDKSSNLLCSRGSSTPGNHMEGLLSELHRKPALAVERLERSKTGEIITSRASSLLTNPPLVLAAIILFAFSISHLMHSQKMKRYRYRNHILGIGLLVGTAVGVWKTEENLLMEGKSYLAGSAVLALLVSWVVHGAFRIGGKDMRRNVRDCDCGCGCD